MAATGFSIPAIDEPNSPWPIAKRLPRRLPRKGVAAKGQKAALEALFKTYPINGNDDDDDD